jgi:O-antigen/teichoic acid export membrane protein
MMFCTLVSGVMFYAVHPFAKKIPDAEYGILGLLLALLNCMSIPSVGLQMVFAQQTAAAVDSRRRHELSGTARGVLLGILVIWLGVVGMVVTFQDHLLARWQFSNSTGLWLMLVVGLSTMCSPVFSGILQGQQNFLWVGWSSMLTGTGRLLAVAIIVLVFHGYAAGMAAGILFGSLVGLAIGAAVSRGVWLRPGAPVAWRAWLARVVPLTFGFGAFQFMFSADPLFVQAWFDKDQTGFYTAAGTLGRALVVFTGPIAAVMFPLIVRGAALSEPTQVMRLTLAVTAGLAGFAALGLSLVAPRLLTVIYKDTYHAAVPLLPWFAVAMVPLALANVIQTLGVFNCGFLATVGLFSWIDARRSVCATNGRTRRSTE